jgi:hypothetical protein
MLTTPTAVLRSSRYLCTAQKRTYMYINDHLQIEPAAYQMSEAELLALLTERVSVLFEQQPDLLMSLLYRLDVEEDPIHRALQPNAPEPATVGLAKLILARQKQRFQTKQSVNVDPLIDEEDRW